MQTLSHLNFLSTTMCSSNSLLITLYRKNFTERYLERIKTDWRNNWRNEIIFEDTINKEISAEYITEYGDSKLPSRFFHGNIKNLHNDTSARNCVAYLESYKILFYWKTGISDRSYLERAIGIKVEGCDYSRRTNTSKNK